MGLVEDGFTMWTLVIGAAAVIVTGFACLLAGMERESKR